MKESVYEIECVGELEEKGRVRIGRVLGERECVKELVV